MFAPLVFEGGGLRETKLGHLHVQVGECEGVVGVVLAVFVSGVVKRFLWLWRCRRRGCCSLWRNKKGILESWYRDECTNPPAAHALKQKQHKVRQILRHWFFFKQQKLDVGISNKLQNKNVACSVNILQDF